jgi:chromosomal replication initiator protein
MTELLGGAEPTSVTVDKIFAAIEKKYDVTRQELTGNSRVKNVAQARHVAIYLIKTITDISYPSIGRIFNRNHATVISSVEVIKKKISTSPAVEIEISELIKEIKE